MNVSLVKQTSLSESMSLQFRAEFFNFFNRPNFDLPDIFLGSPTFGRIFSAQSPRHIQFGLKFLFLMQEGFSPRLLTYLQLRYA